MIYIVSTDPKKVTGGIAKSIKSLCDILGENNVQYENIVTHFDGQGKFSKISLIFKAILRIITIEHNSVLFFHAGGKNSIYRKAFLIMLAKFRGHKVLLQVHGPSLSDNLQSYSYQKFFKYLNKKVDALIVLTDWWKDLLTGYNDNIHVIPNSIDIQPKRINRDLNSNRKILFMSRLIRGKGAHLAISAMSNVENCELIIAGDGPEKESLKSLTNELGLNNKVKFLGWVKEEEKSSLLLNTDLFLLPSKEDSFGMGYIEAMSYSIPCIALAFKSVVDVVSNDVGISIEIKDKNDEVIVNDISKKINYIFSNKEVYKSLSVNSYNKVRNSYDSDIVSKRILSTIETLV